MKTKAVLILMAFVVSLSSYSQVAESKSAIGISFVKNEYNGDYGNGMYDFNQPVYAGLSLSYSKFISKSFDVNILGTTGRYGYWESAVDHFVGLKSDFSLSIHYKLNNGYFFSEYSKLSPFITMGLGFASYAYSNDAQPNPTIILDTPDLIAPIGFGLKYQLNRHIAIQYQYRYVLTNSDVHDQNRSGGVVNSIFHTPSHPAYRVGNDVFGQHLLGVVLSFGKPIDTDKDGVFDKFDLCSNTPSKVKVDEDGCPIDTDYDGVPDYLDKCANTPLRVKVDGSGCPLDTDKDGIPDYMDK